MNIYILHDGLETGPYSWVDISVMLHNGELDESVLVRIEDESKPIADWGFWCEGAEAGPFTWDEISRLLEAGVLDLETKARFTDSSRMSSLCEVIRRSREVSLDEIPAPRPRVLAALLGIPEVVLARPLKTTAVLACLALLLCGIAVLTHRKTPSSQSKVALQKEALPGPTVPAITGHISDVPPSPLLPADPPAAKTLASSSQPDIPTELPKSEPALPLSVTQQDSEAADPVPDVSATPDLATQAAAAGDTGSSTLVAKGQEPDSTAEPHPPISKASPSIPKASPPIAAIPSGTPKAVAALVGDFFTIQSVKLLKKEPKDKIGVWRFSEDKKKPVPDEFQPCLEVKVAAKENTRSDKLTGRVYFFDANNTLLASALMPSKAGKPSNRSHFEMPVLFYKDKPDRIFFEIPIKIRDTKWKAVVVFGDKHEAQSACFPTTESDFLLTYPEKELVYDRTTKRVARKAAMDPLIEHLVKTRNPQMPEVTLFLRPPKGISEASDVKGVLAICLLANSLEDMKRELRKEEMPGDYAGLFSFANKHKLAIVAWGSRRLWDPGRNYDELPKEKAREIDASLDTVATAWERGVKELGEKYGIPQKNFLLWGNCGSAQWAQRLCLRKPEYFLAVHIHMPGSYDKPTPEAANVLWCLTIGELEGGYERSKRWVKTVREMGYPIVYKAIPGLGHAGHPDAAALGFEFYAFALAHKSELEEYKKKNSRFTNTARSQTSGTGQPWPAVFQNPPYYGDMVNQELYPSDEVAMIPPGFRISLPTKKLADIWARNK